MKKQYIPGVIALTAVALVISIFSYNTVWLGDDINYAYDFRPDHREEVVSSLSQIVSSLNEHYLTVNGRYVPHIFVQFFCGIWGHTSFAIANALFYIVFMLALFKLCRVGLDNNRGLLSTILFALIVFQTKMVPSCQIGYIWTFALSMIFLSLFFSKKIYPKMWQVFLLGIFSIIAGNGNEALTLGISGAMIIYWFKHMRQMSVAQYVMMICFGMGTLVICMSPGASSRAAETTTGLFTTTGIYYNILNMFLTLKASFVLVLILLWQKYKTGRSIKEIYKENAFYFNVWLIMLAFNAVIGYNSNRQVFGAELMAIIISMRLLKKHSFTKLWMVLSSVILILLYVAQFQMVAKVKNIYWDIENQYSISSDGYVYVDIDNSNNVPYSMEFSPHIPMCSADKFQNYSYSNLAKQLKTFYPGHEELSILPVSLKKYQIEHSEIIALPQQDIYFVIKSLKDDRKFYIDRRIDNVLIQREYPPLELDMDQCVYSDSTWMARYVDLHKYTILELSDQSISLK